MPRGWVATVLLLTILTSHAALAQRQMESLDRGIVAIRQPDGNVFVGWRVLGTDPADGAFNLYRATAGNAPTKLNDEPITSATSFNDAKPDLAQSSTYTVRLVQGGNEQPALGAFTLPANAPAAPYITTPLQTP